MQTIPLTPGRVPPHDQDAELSVLGSILLDPLSVAKVLQFLHPEDFYRENNGQIYKEKAYKRRLISAGSNIAGFGYDDGVEAEEAINQAQSLVFGVADDRDQRELSKLYDLLGPAMERISLQMESGQGIVGIPSGFHDLDRMTGGFKDSDLIIVAGRPAMGKTSLANTLIDDPDTGARITLEECIKRQLSRVYGF